MAVMNAQAMTEEERHNVISNAFLTEFPVCPGVNIKCVRHVTPLVMVALQRANNPFITGRAGFQSAGIEFGEDGKQVTDVANFAIAMMPATAEILVLLSCTRDELKRFATGNTEPTLRDKALDIMEEATMQQITEATSFVTEQLHMISKAQVTNSPEDQKPEAEALKGADDSPKMPAPTG